MYEDSYTPGLRKNTNLKGANPGETAYLIEDWRDPGRTKNGDFININFRKTTLKNIKFENCRFNVIRLELDSQISFDEVMFLHCAISSVILIRDQEEVESAFSPVRIYQILKRLSIEVLDDEDRSSVAIVEESEFKKLVNRFLLKFNKTVYQYEKKLLMKNNTVFIQMTL